MTPSARESSQSGFTLLELLVAITLLAFLSLALTAGLRFGTDIWRKSQAKNVDTSAMRTAQRVLSDRLERTYPKFVMTAPDQAHIDFDGSHDRLTFLSTAPSDGGQIMRDVVQAVPEGGDLTMRIGTVSDLAPASAPISSTALLHHLAAVEFSYFGTARDSKEAAWHGTWQNQNALPNLIRVRVAFAGSGVTPWPEMILVPRIEADADCIYDALTKFCRGRQ